MKLTIDFNVNVTIGATPEVLASLAAAAAGTVGPMGLIRPIGLMGEETPGVAAAPAAKTVGPIGLIRPIGLMGEEAPAAAPAAAAAAPAAPAAAPAAEAAEAAEAAAAAEAIGPIRPISPIGPMGEPEAPTEAPTAAPAAPANPFEVSDDALRWAMDQRLTELCGPGWQTAKDPTLIASRKSCTKCFKEIAAFLGAEKPTALPQEKRDKFVKHLEELTVTQGTGIVTWAPF